MAVGNDDITSQRSETRRPDKNRELRLKAHRLLDRMLALAEAADFSGAVSIEVSAEKGRLTRIQDAYRGYHK